MFKQDIDIVVPFVNNHDEVWVNNFIAFCKENGYEERISEINKERYDNYGLFDCWFDCVEKFMPWVRTIYLILSNIEQVSSMKLSEKVKIILHKDFIPAQYLPTFNSRTIEMFLWNIPDLSEYFIYSNDDIFPIKWLRKDQFFSNCGKVKIRIAKRGIQKDKLQGFLAVCFNNYKILSSMYNQNDVSEYFLMPTHSMTPMIKSHCKECFESLKDYIASCIAPFRQDNQVNQYIYPLYEYFNNNTENTSIFFRYAELKEDIRYIVKIVESQQCQIVCINDVPAEHRELINYDKIKELLTGVSSNSV